MSNTNETNAPASEPTSRPTVGWIGLGRMGAAMAARLVEAGYDVSVWNRTASKADPLAEKGAKVVDSPAALADRDIVFTMVSGPADLIEVVSGPAGLLSNPDAAPRILVESSSASEAASQTVREALQARGAQMLVAPVSGNAKVVKAGKIVAAVSGPHDTHEEVLPLMSVIAPCGVTYVGEGDAARAVKICHNLMLAIVAQTMAEITVLAEKKGISRKDFLDFLNQSVMGSTFTHYKTPSFVNLDLTPTFTPPLLRKDLDLGLEIGRETRTPLPLTSATAEIVQAMVGRGHTDCDFSILLHEQAAASGLKLESENADVSDGLS